MLALRLRRSARDRHRHVVHRVLRIEPPAETGDPERNAVPMEPRPRQAELIVVPAPRRPTHHERVPAASRIVQLLQHPARLIAPLPRQRARLPDIEELLGDLAPRAARRTVRPHPAATPVTTSGLGCPPSSIARRTPADRSCRRPAEQRAPPYRAGRPASPTEPASRRSRRHLFRPSSTLGRTPPVRKLYDDPSQRTSHLRIERRRTARQPHPNLRILTHTVQIWILHAYSTHELRTVIKAPQRFPQQGESAGAWRSEPGRPPTAAVC